MSRASEVAVVFARCPRRSAWWQRALSFLLAVVLTVVSTPLTLAANRAVTPEARLALAAEATLTPAPRQSGNIARSPAPGPGRASAEESDDGRSPSLSATAASLPTNTPSPTPPGASCLDEFEPDDSPGQARLINPSDRKEDDHSIHTRADGSADEDWWVATFDGDRNYNVNVTGVGAGLTLQISLYDSSILTDGSATPVVVSVPNGDGATVLQWHPSPGGVYYVRVRSVTGASGCGRDYRYDFDIKALDASL